MRAFYRFVILLICLNTIVMGEGLTGEKIIGAGGDYDTFSAAITDLNNKGVGLGGVTFLIKGGTYSEATALCLTTTSSSASRPIIFKAYNSELITLNTFQSNTKKYCVRIESDYVTFEGDTTSSEFNFVINSTNTTYSFYGFDIVGSNNIIKKCKIDFPSKYYVSGSTGIYLRNDCNDCLIDNNEISASIGIAVGSLQNSLNLPCNSHKISRNYINFNIYGINANARFNNLSISSNILSGNLASSISASATVGININSTHNVSPYPQIIIKANEVFDCGNQAAGSYVVNGITVSGFGNFTITKNKVHSLNNESGGGINGIQCAYSANESLNNIFYLNNNFVYNFQNISYSRVAQYINCFSLNAIGIYNVFNNSVFLDMNYNATDINILSFVRNYSYSLEVNIKNNIFHYSNINNDSNIGFYYFDNGLSNLINIDYNNYYSHNSSHAFFGTFNANKSTSLSSWKTFINNGNETHSQEFDPLFHSPTDLHLLPNSPCAGKGVTIAGIETDIDGDTRKNPPDIGADEFTAFTLTANGNTSNPPAGSPTNIIPTSSAGGVEINPSTTSTGNISAFFFNQAPSGNLPSEVTTISNYHWVLSTNMHNFETDVIFYFDNIIDNGIDNPENIVLLKRENQSEDWQIYSNVEIGSNYIKAKGLTQFSEFAIGQNNATPVEATNFYSCVNGNTVILNWETATELNSYSFLIERKSYVDNTWKTMDTILTKGNSNTTNYYGYKEYNVFSGSYSYRIKHINTNGSYEYIKTFNITVGAPNNFILHQNYPNPFNPSTTINFDLPITTNTKISIYNITGEKLFTLIDEKLEAGNYSYAFNFSSLASGVYFYRLETTEFVSVKKMILLR